MTTLSTTLAGIVLLTASFSTASGQKVKVAPKLQLQAEAKTIIELKVDARHDAKAEAQAVRIQLNVKPQAVRVQAKAQVLIERNGERIRLVEAPNVSWNPNTVSNKTEDIPENIDSSDLLRLFDGSQIRGQLIELTGNRFLQWENE
ncbi:MAG: hypothetical protein VCA18_04680, partial [Opitutales bacterium]